MALMSRFSMLLLGFLAAAGCGNDAWRVERNIAYDPAHGIYGTLDFYEPEAASVGGRPAILAIHGGSWRGGDKAWGQQIADEFCPAGYVVFAVNYRLSKHADGKWPAQIEDVQNALKHIRAHARHFGVDPQRIAALGMSAGGHLATMVALREDPSGPQGRVTTAVNLDGEHDMTMPPARVMADFDDIMTAVMGHASPWSEAELRDISTVTFVRPDVAVLSVHGAGDDNVYVAQGDRIHSALLSGGARSEYVRIEGKAGNCHEDCWRVPVARQAIHRFLEDRLNPSNTHINN